MKKPIVSFDFDGTLSRPDVQEFAKELLDLGVEVRVTTTRYDDMHSHKYGDDYPPEQDDLWSVVDRLGIPRHHVRYTNMEWKYTYLMGTAFLFHLDDNEHEFARARYNSCKIPMIQVNGGGWQKKCMRILTKKAQDLLIDVPVHPTPYSS
jgi:hypothetical protein